ncbi:MAG: BlaI/MecI/CopY family transcriptional regulator [candidate division Zixibacteria bacterium]|nr:BlaI/MecI/CopY family transcriptional regulator [candidate division Zixibacteria bacterium]
MAKLPFYFDPTATGVGVFLGPTEAQLMELAWREGPMTVKKALFLLGNDCRLAYTTVMTVLARLEKKGLLDRKKDGRGFVYTVAIKRAKFIEGRLKIVNDCLRANFKAK